MFQVFVEGPRAPGPGAIAELARAIAKHYGLPAPDIEARIAGGRFRVKSNIDRATAEQYALELERLGARTSIVPLDVDLGALGRDAPMSLAALDGSDARPPPPPASFGPPPTSQHQMFAPPDEEAPVELAIDIDEDRMRRKGSAAPPPGPSVPPPASPEIATETDGHEPFVALPPARVRASLGDRVKDWLADDRKRFVTGVVLAIAIGFVPAHVVASIREGSSFSDVDARVIERQTAAQTAEQWDQLDKVRAAMLDRKYGERRDIALTAIAIWAAIAGGLGYVWFRRIDWDRVLA